MKWEEIWNEVKEISRTDPPKRSYILNGEKKVACLKDYQVDSLKAISYVFQRQNAVILADEVGLGKTWVALELASRVISNGGVVAVVAKRDLLVNNWEKDWNKGWEQTKVGKSSRSGVAKIKLVEKKNTWQQRNTRLYFVPMTFARNPNTNSNSKVKVKVKVKVKEEDGWKTIIRKIHPDLIVIDESQNFKSELRRELIDTLRKNDTKLLALTATPLDIEISENHWRKVFDLLGLTETKYKDILNRIFEISNEIKADSNDEEQKSTKLIKEYQDCINKYRQLFEGIIFRNRKQSNYALILQELAGATELSKNRIANCVKNRIKKNDLPIKIEEGSDNEIYWNSMICAFEALSFCKGEKAEVRARLTVGSAHSLFKNLYKWYRESGEDASSPERRIWKEIVRECLVQLTGIKRVEDLGEKGEKGKKKIIEANPLYVKVIELVEKHYRSEVTKNEGVLIFSYNTKPTEEFCKLLEKRLEKIDKERGNAACLEYCACIDGSTSKEKRKRIIEKFNGRDNEKAKLKCLIAQIKVGGEGLNLHKNCDTVIFLHPEWNPRSIDQGVGRVDRLDSLWFRKLKIFLEKVKNCSERNFKSQQPQITVYIPKFSGTYDISKWEVLEKRWVLMDEILNGTEDQRKDPFNPRQYLAKHVPEGNRGKSS